MFTQPFARKERHNAGIKGRLLFSIYKQAKLLSKCLLKVANDLVVDLAVCLQASAHMCLCANVLLGLLGKRFFGKMALSPGGNAYGYSLG